MGKKILTKKNHSVFYDVILGGQDGLVNVLGLSLGLWAASSGSHTILVAGLAAGIAESISMGAVSYTSTFAQKDFYLKTKEIVRTSVENEPLVAKDLVISVFRDKGFNETDCNLISSSIFSDKELFINTILSDYYKVYPINVTGILISSITVGISAMIGSLFPLVPYILFAQGFATGIAILVSGFVLFFVGAYKSLILVGSWWKSGLQLLTIGLISAFAGFVIGLLLNVK